MLFLGLLFLLVFNQSPTIAVAGVLIIVGIYLFRWYRSRRVSVRPRGILGSFIGIPQKTENTESDLLSYLVYRDYMRNDISLVPPETVPRPTVNKGNLIELYEDEEENVDWEKRILQMFDEVS